MFFSMKNFARGYRSAFRFCQGTYLYPKSGQAAPRRKGSSKIRFPNNWVLSNLEIESGIHFKD